VLEGGSADKAGLKAGDIIVRVDGRPIRTGADLRNRIGLKPVGQQMEIEYYRSGKLQRADATIVQPSQQVARGADLNRIFEGAALRDYLDVTGAPAAVEVVSVERRGAAYRAGFRP